MEINRFISPLAIFYGIFVIVTSITLFALSPSRDLVGLLFMGIAVAFAYIGFGYLLKITKDVKVVFTALLSLAAIAVLSVIEPNVMSGKFVINFVHLAIIILILPDLIRTWRIVKKKK